MMNIVERLRDYADGLSDYAADMMGNAADEIERLREEHETVSRIVDGMTLQFVERGKEIERLQEVRDMLQAINEAKDKEIAILRAEKHLAALKEGE
jgi:hypothetical protein